MGKWGDLALGLREKRPAGAAEPALQPTSGTVATGPNDTNGTPHAMARRGCGGTAAPSQGSGATKAGESEISPALAAFRERVQADLDEVAAVHEFEGGLPREIADALVALRSWRPAPWRPGQSGHARLQAACILADDWGASALACGWSASELLGDGGPLDRLAGMSVVCIDEHGADARGHDGRYARYNRRYVQRVQKCKADVRGLGVHPRKLDTFTSQLP